MGAVILEWIDLIWVPVALLLCTKTQRVQTLVFVLLCSLTLRLQCAMIYSTGHSDGFTPLFTGDVRLRAIATYSIFIAVYLLLLSYSPNAKWYVMMSASIVVYITAFVSSMLLMIL